LHTIGSIAGAAGLGDIAGIAALGGAAGGGAGALATAAIAKLIGTLKEFVGASSHAEESQVNLDAALRNAGELIPEVRAKYNALAGALKEKTEVGFKGALAILEEFGANRSNIDSAAEAVKNLAARTGDAEMAASMYGKALGGSFTAFQHLGIQIDENLSQAEKLKRLNDALATMFGGILEAKARTTAGAIKKISEEWERLTATVGGSVQVKEVFEILGNKLAWLADHFKRTIPVQKEMLDGLNKLPRSYEDAEAGALRLAHASEARAEADALSLRVMKELDDEEGRRATAEDALAKAESARNKARIDLAIASGHMTKDQGDAAKRGIDDKAQEEQFAREQKRDKERLDAAQKRMDKLNEQSRVAQENVAKLEAQDKAAADFQADEARAKKSYDRMMETKHNLDEAEKNVDRGGIDVNPETGVSTVRPPDQVSVNNYNIAKQLADEAREKALADRAAHNALPVPKPENIPTPDALKAARAERDKFFTEDGKGLGEIHALKDSIDNLRAAISSRETVQNVTRQTRAEASEPALTADAMAGEQALKAPKMKDRAAGVKAAADDSIAQLTRERDEIVALLQAAHASAKDIRAATSDVNGLIKSITEAQSAAQMQTQATVAAVVRQQHHASDEMAKLRSQVSNLRNQ
jgi:hypothetical protein